MLADTVSGFITVFRGEVGDTLIDISGGEQACLWKKADILGYLTEASDALAKATNALRETITIPFVAGDRTVPKPKRVLHIYEARLVTADQLVDVNNANTAFRRFSNTGRPREIYRDHDRNKIRFYPTPTQDDSLEIVCSSTLSKPVLEGDAMIFMDVEDQRLLLEYMKWRAYSKQDAETEDLSRAKIAFGNWQSGSVDRESSLRNQERAPGQIQMEW